ncbi:unnamed protein product [Wuchereria bancrofti]|uniref:Uncharacterized protein n=1 Tax=Wuchereria bancrofti TaxID=6293 RepID=A0A3P7EEI3_WUCBA|nr:unnamed protein product [Wuchereria bancrofti]
MRISRRHLSRPRNPRRRRQSSQRYPRSRKTTSRNESNETESEAETYASDEQMPSLLDDDDSNIHWDDDMDLNELLLRFIVITVITMMMNLLTEVEM